MLTNILLSTVSHIVTTVPKTTSPALMQYVLLLMMSGAAFLSKKQLKNALRKMNWQLFKQSFKNMFKSNSGNSKKIRRIILLVLGGLLIWWLYTLIGIWSLLFLILLVYGFSTSKNI
jgi:hypothetical protein